MSLAVELAVKAQTKSFEDGFKRMHTSSERLNKTLEDMSRNTIAGLNAGFTRMQQSMGRTTRDTKKLEHANEALRKKMTAMQAATGKGTSGLKGMTGALKGGLGGVLKFAGGVGIAAAAIGVLGVVIFRTIRALSRFSEDFRKMEFAIAKTGALIDATSGHLRKMRTEVSAMSSEVGRSTQDLAAGFFDIVSAGNSATDAMIILRQAGKLATGGFAETKDTADILTAAINAYGLSARDATRVSDVLFQTQKLGKTTISELSQSLGSLLPIAAATGTSLEDMGAALATLTGGRAGTGRTVQAVTTLRTLLSSILKPSKQATKLADELGIQWNATALAAKGFAGFIQDLQVRFNSTDESIRLTASDLGVLSGRIRGMTAALSLVGKQAKDFNEDVDKMGESAGTTERAFESMRNTSLQVWEEAKNAWVEFKEAMGQGIVSVLRPALEDLTKLLVGLAERIRDAANAWDLMKEKASGATTSLADDVLEYVDDAQDQGRATQIARERSDKEDAAANRSPLGSFFQRRLRTFSEGGRGYTTADFQQAQQERQLPDQPGSEIRGAYGMSVNSAKAGLSGSKSKTQAHKARRDQLAQTVLDQQADRREIRLTQMQDDFKAQRATLDHQLVMDKIGKTEYVLLRQEAVDEALAFAKAGIDANGAYNRNEEAKLAAFKLDKQREVDEATHKRADEIIKDARANTKKLADEAIAAQKRVVAAQRAALSKESSLISGANRAVRDNRTDEQNKVGLDTQTQELAFFNQEAFIKQVFADIDATEDLQRRALEAVELARQKFFSQRKKDEKKAAEDLLKADADRMEEAFSKSKAYSDHKIAMGEMTAEGQLSFLEDNYAKEIAGNKELAEAILAIKRKLAEAGYQAEKEALEKLLALRKRTAPVSKALNLVEGIENYGTQLREGNQYRAAGGIGGGGINYGGKRVSYAAGSIGPNDASLHGLRMQMRQGDRMGLNMQGSQFANLSQSEIGKLSSEDFASFKQAIEDNTAIIGLNTKEYALRKMFTGMAGSRSAVMSGVGNVGTAAMDIRTASLDKSMSGGEKLDAIGSSLQTLGSTIGGKTGGFLSGAGRVAGGAGQGAMVGAAFGAPGAIIGGAIGGGLALAGELISAFSDTDEFLNGMLDNIKNSFTSIAQVITDAMKQGFTGDETKKAVDDFVKNMIFQMSVAKIIQESIGKEGGVLDKLAEAFEGRNEKGGQARLEAAMAAVSAETSSLAPGLVGLGRSMGVLPEAGIRELMANEEQGLKDRRSRFGDDVFSSAFGQNASSMMQQELGFNFAGGVNPNAKQMADFNKMWNDFVQDLWDGGVAGGTLNPFEGVTKAPGMDAVPIRQGVNGGFVPKHLGTGGVALNHGQILALEDAQAREKLFGEQTALADSTAGSNIATQLAERQAAMKATPPGGTEAIKRNGGFQVTTISGAMRDTMKNGFDGIVNVLEDIYDVLAGNPGAAGGGGGGIRIEGDFIMRVDGEVNNGTELIQMMEVALGQELRLNAGQVGGGRG